jgi:hypothetical protein
LSGIRGVRNLRGGPSIPQRGTIPAVEAVMHQVRVAERQMTTPVPAAIRALKRSLRSVTSQNLISGTGSKRLDARAEDEDEIKCLLDRVGALRS